MLDAYSQLLLTCEIDMFFTFWSVFCILNSALVLMYIFKGKHFTLDVFVPKVGHHVALDNVHSGCHVVVHECEK